MLSDHLTSSKNAFSVLILATVIALYLFANSSFFLAEQVEWQGLAYLSPEQLDLYADIGSINVWRLDTRQLAALLRQHPWVEAATVSWRWPNRIVVSLRERRPVAQVPSEGGWLFLDRQGNILPPTRPEGVQALLVVTNLDLNSKEQVIAAARLISSIPAELEEYFSEWNASSSSFVSCSGVEILMGQAVGFEDKFLLLQTILDDLKARGERARRIDLRTTKNPVVTIL